MNESDSIWFYVITIFSASIFAFLSQVNFNKEKFSLESNYKNLNYREGNYYNKFFIFLSFVCLALPVALRQYTGTDYASYVELYNNISYLGPFSMVPQYEGGYVLLNYFCFVIFNNYHSVFIITALLSNIFIYKGILYERKKINLGIAVFAYGFTLYFLEFVIIRNILGIAIIFYGYRYLLEKKQTKFFIIVTIACMFHYSMAIYYIFGMLFKDKLKKLRVPIVLGLVVSIIVLPNISTYIFNSLSSVIPRLGYYSMDFSSAEENNRNISLYMIAYTLPVILFIINYKKLIKQNSNNYFYFYMYLISILFLFLSMSNPILTRFVYALWPSLIILLASFVKLFDRTIIIKMIIIIYGTALIIKFVTIESYGLLPYKHMFEIFFK